MRVLVVDDEEDVRSVVARARKADGHAVTTAADLASARVRLGEGADLVVLDLRDLLEDTADTLRGADRQRVRLGQTTRWCAATPRAWPR